MPKEKHLSESQKHYILENLDSLTNKQIAKDLGISRDTVQKFRENKAVKSAFNNVIKSIDAEKFISEKLHLDQVVIVKVRKYAPYLIFACILFFAFNLRKPTFNLPHIRGDQSHYAALAFKLDTKGIPGYNLRNVDMLLAPNSPFLAKLAASKDKGSVLKDMEAGNIFYYDEPLHHMPWGFPAALMLSHRIFAHGEPYYVSLIQDDQAEIRKYPPGVGLRDFRFPPDVPKKHFYAVIVPLLCSLLLIACVYLLAKELYDSQWIAFTAMFLMAISPIDLLASQKVWADDMTAGFAALSGLLFVVASKKDSALLALLSGISLGISVLAKQLGIFVAFGIVGWHFLSNIDKLFKKDTFLKVIFDKKLILFSLGAFLTAGYWFYKVYATYGTPLYRPVQENLTGVAQTDWFKMVQNRPRSLYLVGIPYQNPLFALAYLSPLWLFLSKDIWRKHLFPIAWLIVPVYFAFNSFAGGEHRYFLPNYAPVAILSAYVADVFRRSIDKNTKLKAGSIILIISLWLSANWSIPIAYNVLFHNEAEIFRPF